jgi:hypothetical protein
LIGFFHIDLAEARTAEGKLYLLMAIDRTSKFAVAERVEWADLPFQATVQRGASQLRNRGLQGVQQSSSGSSVCCETQR